MKQAKTTTKTRYEAIKLPKNSPLGIIIGGLSGGLGFGLVWHIWWLSALCFFGIIASLIYRISQEDTKYTIPAAEVAKIETGGQADNE